jgi:hypothetical protein
MNWGIQQMFKPNDYELMKEYCQRQEQRCEAVRMGDEVQSRKRVLRMPIRVLSLVLIGSVFTLLLMQVSTLNHF